MTQQSNDKRYQLLLAVLKRAGKPVGSDDVLDAATGLALDGGWSPAQLKSFSSRRSVSKLLQNMLTSGLVSEGPQAIDAGARRSMPTYQPVDGYDLRAPVPPPPEGEVSPRASARSSYDGMSQPQLLAVLEAHDDVIECIGRFFHDLSNTREKVRRRLAAVGLERI